MQTGGSVEAPAIELVEVARSLAKLDELAARVQAIELLPGDDPAAYERTGLSPENAHEEPENRRGPASVVPLKPQAWNRLVLSVTGDKVALELNGQPIYERSLEPSNQRSFALFHYAGETQARVRNVTNQGNWARSLPASIHPQPK